MGEPEHDRSFDVDPLWRVGETRPAFSFGGPKTASTLAFAGIMMVSHPLVAPFAGSLAWVAGPAILSSAAGLPTVAAVRMLASQTFSRIVGSVKTAAMFFFSAASWICGVSGMQNRANMYRYKSLNTRSEVDAAGFEASACAALAEDRSPEGAWRLASHFMADGNIGGAVSVFSLSPFNPLWECRVAVSGGGLSDKMPFHEALRLSVSSPCSSSSPSHQQFIGLSLPLLVSFSDMVSALAEKMQIRAACETGSSEKPESDLMDEPVLASSPVGSRRRI